MSIRTTGLFRAIAAISLAAGSLIAPSITATAAELPPAPENLSWVGKAPNSVTAEWEAPIAEGIVVDNYLVEWSKDGNTWSSAETTELSMVISGLLPGTEYQVRVSAHTVDGWGAATAVVYMHTTNPPDKPSGLAKTSRSATSFGLSWQVPGSDGLTIDKYKTEYSVDGKSWLGKESVATNVLLDGLSAGMAYQVRVSAHSAAGWGTPSNAAYIFTMGTRAMRFAFQSSTGAPLTGGAVTWKLDDGSLASSTTYGVTSNGVLEFPRTAAGVGTVTATDLVMPSGATVSGSWRIILGIPQNVLKVPAEPNSVGYSVTVNMPNDQPVLGATVSATGLTGSYTSGKFTFSVPVVSSTTTADNGIAALQGYASGTPTATVTYDDGMLMQTKQVVLQSASTTVTLDEMPWLDLALDTSTAQLNGLVPIDISLDDPAITQLSALLRLPSRINPLALSGVQVKVTPPAGATQACAKKVLSAVTNSQGKARLMICATKSGVYKISAQGAVATSNFQLKVRGTAPLPANNLRGSSPSLGTAKLNWSPPSFNGGAVVTSYVVTLTGGGKTFTQTVKTMSATFTGLKNATTYTAEVKGVNVNGTGDAATVKVPVA